MSRQTRSVLSHEYALLGFLNDQPAHAYQIYQRLRKASDLRLIWTIKQGQLYALLARLEEEGFIAASVEPQEGRPPRKMLSLTPAGEAFYRSWMISPVHRPRQFRQEFLAKLYCASQSGPPALRALLDAQRSAADAMAQDLAAQIAAAPDDRPYERLVYRLRLVQTEAHLRWLDECRQTLLQAEG